MMLSRKNLKGGVVLKTFPLTEERGYLGYKLGYCDGCNEPILIRTIDTQEVLSFLFYSTEQYKKLLKNLKPKISFKKRFIKWIIGRLGEQPIIVEEPVYN